MQEHQNKSCTNFWRDDELSELGKALTFAYKTQNNYKEPLDLKDRVLGWKFVLEEDYTVTQVLSAIKQHMKTSPVMPVPADIGAILSPPEPKITEAQFVEAQKWQERNGWPFLSEAAQTIEKYKKQRSEDYKDYQTEFEKIEELKRQGTPIERDKTDIQKFISGAIKKI